MAAGRHRARGRASSQVRRGQPRHGTSRQGARAQVASRGHVSGTVNRLLRGFWK